MISYVAPGLRSFQFTESFWKIRNCDCYLFRDEYKQSDTNTSLISLCLYSSSEQLSIAILDLPE
jgi:hypothetical protein